MDVDPPSSSPSSSSSSTPTLPQSAIARFQARQAQEADNPVPPNFSHPTADDSDESHVFGHARLQDQNPSSSSSSANSWASVKKPTSVQFKSKKFDFKKYLSTRSALRWTTPDFNSPSMLKFLDKTSPVRVHAMV